MSKITVSVDGVSDQIPSSGKVIFLCPRSGLRNQDSVTPTEFKTCSIQSLDNSFVIIPLSSFDITSTEVAKLKPVYQCGIQQNVTDKFWGIFTSAIGSVITTILGLIFSVIALVCTVLLILVFAFLEWMIGMSNHDLSIVQVIWIYIRDICNMFFILILVYIAFRTVISRSSSTLSKMLPTFLAAVILINFSKVICETVLGASDVLIKLVYHLKDNGATGNELLNGGIAGQAWGIVNFVARAAGMDSLFKIWQPAGDLFKNAQQGGAPLETLLTTIASMMLGIVYMVLAVIVFGVAGVLLAYRIIIIWILTAISPAIYAAWGAGMSGTVKKFWDEFLKTAFFAPAMIFCIVLSVYVLSPVVTSDINKDYTTKVTEQINKGNQAGSAQDILKDGSTTGKMPVEAVKFENFIRLIFALCFMWAGIVVAKKASVFGSQAVITGAEKIAKQGGNWISMYKPSKAGLKALGRWGWERQLKRHPGLGFISPTAWKQAYTAHRDRTKREIYTPAAAKLQARISGPQGFFLGRGKNYKREKIYADSVESQMAEKHKAELLATNLPTEQFIKMFDEIMNKMKKQGNLGTNKALNFETEGILRAIMARGDINDWLKNSKHATEFTNGKATTGADMKAMIGLFGKGEKSARFANVLSEASKDKYGQFIGMAGWDKDGEEVRFDIDTKKARAEIQKEADALSVSYESLFQTATMQLGNTRQQILASSEIKDDSTREAVARIIGHANDNRSAYILSELNKKDPHYKWRVHPGTVWGDMSSEAQKAAGAPKGVKYWGETTSTRAFLESITIADANKVNGWSDARNKQAWLDNEKNAKDIIADMAKSKDAAEAAAGERLAPIIEQLYRNLKSGVDQGGGQAQGGGARNQGNNQTQQRATGLVDPQGRPIRQANNNRQNQDDEEDEEAMK